MAISTKNTRKPGISKDFKPGNHELKINKIRLTKSDTPKDPKKPEYRLMLELETHPIGDGFEGFPIDSDDLSKGHYKGQIKTVIMSDFPIREWSYTDKKTGKLVVRPVDEQICEHLAKITTALKSDWMEKADGKYNTVAELVEGFNRTKPFKGIYLDFCIAGTAKKVDNYIKYYCFLPEYKVCETSIAAVGDSKFPVTPYNKDLHLKYMDSVATSTALNDDEEETEIEDEENEFATENDDFDQNALDDEELFEIEED